MRDLVYEMWDRVYVIVRGDNGWEDCFLLDRELAKERVEEEIRRRYPGIDNRPGGWSYEVRW